MNRLADATSPYLQQHKDNPVHWWTWGPEALAEARRTGKPILLSVGYAACHWCHVMAHESFEDEATAAVMNELFVCIKVDREERPDIDAIYMGALHRLGEQGGWPLTMFLDSATRPFFGGTYFPKEGRYGRPSFVSVMHQVARVYAEQPETVTHNADMLTGMLEQAAKGDGGAGRVASLDLAAVGHLLARMPSAMDSVNGGLKGAPKFPQWSFLALLWRGAIRFGHQGCRDAALLALERMSQGGIYDHLAGGLARYSVDELWLAPHFEKMLYDNAQYLELLTEAWRETSAPLFAQRAAETVSWLLSEMTTEGGAFAASLDADSDGEEGKFYVWSADEIAYVLGSASAVPGAASPDFELFAAVYDVAPRGNWEGHTILNRLRSGALRDDRTEQRLAAMRTQLLARRTSRIRPGLDDKVLADWNGLMIGALARAAVVFGKPTWLEAARRAFGFITTSMVHGAPSEGRLVHAWRSGKASAVGMASDYANMIWAAVRLYEATADRTYLTQAQTWVAAIDRHHWTEVGGYATSADDATDVLVRLRPASDDATPNANAVMLANLAALAQLTEDPSYLERADELRGAYASELASQPIGHCGFLAAAIDSQAPLHVALSSVGAPEQGAGGDALAAAIHALALPGAIETRGVDREATGNSVDASSNVVVCSGPACSAPIDDPSALRSALREARALRPAATDA